MNGLPIITLLTLVPLLGAVIVSGVGSERKNLARGLAFIVIGIGFLATNLVILRRKGVVAR